MVAEHPVLVRAPAFLGGGAAPAVLRRVDQNFVEGLFRDLGTDALRPRLEGQRLPRADEPDRVLHLPVHRAFNLVLVELVCDVPGQPRLCPDRIESVGLVMRRRPTGKAAAQSTRERWVKELDAVRGWRAASGAALDEDPDPARRPVPKLGVEALDAERAETRARHAIATRQVPSEECTTRLFAAPPDVCARLGATLYFGVVPTDDPAVVEDGLDPTGPPVAYSEAQIESLLPPWLRGAPAAVPAPLGGATIRAREAGGQRIVEARSGAAWVALALPDPSGPAPAGQGPLHAFLRALELLRLYGLYDEATPSAARDALRRTTVGGRTVYDVLRAATDVLVLRETGVEAALPAALPALTTSAAASVRAGIKASLTARAGTLARNEGRFGRADARYVLRVFARVRCCDGCPPVVRWSGETTDFRVARWFESPPAGVVVPQIELPDPTRAFLKNTRPNVTFRVPTALFDLLRNNAPGDFLKGEGKQGGGGVDFVWICGFNLSIIFICAFIFLFVFLILLNFVFWWLPFVKICIPIPVPKDD